MITQRDFNTPLNQPQRNWQQPYTEQPIPRMKGFGGYDLDYDHWGLDRDTRPQRERQMATHEDDEGQEITGLSANSNGPYVFDARLLGTSLGTADTAFLGTTASSFWWWRTIGDAIEMDIKLLVNINFPANFKLKSEFSTPLTSVRSQCGTSTFTTPAFTFPTSSFDISQFGKLATVTNGGEAANWAASKIPLLLVLLKNMLDLTTIGFAPKLVWILVNLFL